MSNFWKAVKGSCVTSSYFAKTQNSRITVSFGKIPSIYNLTFLFTYLCNNINYEPSAEQLPLPIEATAVAFPVAAFFVVVGNAKVVGIASCSKHLTSSAEQRSRGV